ncbi:alpha/beta hydrolase family esterase [Pedobacter paludis]|uniref:alpha/beta hydrolase family esterase n=1 Tax=Pedobacter paludis TaxID=2203212 RepID=UPI00197CDB68|nr:esterase [Pedobacter paludis]
MSEKSFTQLFCKSFLLIGLFLLFGSITPVFAQQGMPRAKLMKWKVDDTTREALVYIPADAKTKSSPIIFVFHGHGGTMGNMFKSRGFEKLWPEAIIVCPQGLNTPGQLTDPEGKLPGWQKAPGDMNDRDLIFFDAMLKTLRSDYKIDNKRIYATGHSNGGGFTYLLWATRGDEFAAFAPSAAVGGRVVNLLKPKPAMHIMGEQDPLVKPAWQKAMCNRILKIDGCTDITHAYAPNATFYPSTTNTPVVLYVHPGGHFYPPEANEVVIKFFKSIQKS